MADKIVSWGGIDSKGTSGMGVTGSLAVSGSITADTTISFYARSVQNIGGSITNDSSDNLIIAAAQGAGKSTYLGPSNGTSVVTGAGSINLYTGNGIATHQMVVGYGSNNSIGNVGIGTSTPAARLTVKGPGTTSSTNAFQVQNANASASLSVRDDGLVTVGGNINFGSVSNYIYWSDGNQRIEGGNNFYNYSGTWSFNRANDSTTVVQIGTGNNIYFRGTLRGLANETLTVTGGSVGGSRGYDLVVKGTNATTGPEYTGGHGGDLILENGLATDNSQGKGGTPGSIIFKYGTYNNTASVEYGRINSSGSFLIGTSTGSAKVLISGSSNSALFEIDSPAVNNILFVSGSGNVGIGTGTPARTLEVNGTIGTTADGVGRGITMGTAVAGASSYLNVGQGTGWLFHLTTNNATYTANSTRMTITDNGVGFGNFVANGGTVSATAQVRGSGTTSSTTSFLVQNSAGTAALTIKDDLSATFTGVITGSYVTLGAASSNQPILVTAGYFVGSGAIATSNSNGRSFNTIIGGQNSGFVSGYNGIAQGISMTNEYFVATGNINLTDGGIDLRGFSFDPTVVSETGATIKAFSSTLSAASNRFNLHLAGTAKNYIAGNVGIGTPSPSASLHVFGDTIITGSLTVSSTTVGAAENTLTLGLAPAGGAGEGGQLGFNATGGTYTSASFIDLWQNKLRVLKGTNAGSSAEVANFDLQTLYLNLPGGAVTMPQRPAFRVTGSSGYNPTANTVISGSSVGIDYNQGGYYNNTNGQFTCPVAGLYHVWYVGRTYAASLASVALYKNNTGTPLAFWESNANSGHFGTSAVVSLAVNDVITAKVTAGQVTFDGNDNWGAAYIG